jgi:glycosyltransferase involved in cell wall biosynthesis
MNVTHVNTFCTGGAAKACLRTVRALNKFGTESTMLVLYKTNEEKDVVDVRDELSFFKNYWQKVTNKLFVLRHEREFGNKEELFSSYNSVWDVSSNSFIQLCDVVHLHWVSGFLDFPSFFNSTKKKIVITMHDYFPFSGGFHYPNPYFEKEPFKTKAEASRKVISNLYKNGNVHFVGSSEYMLKRLKATPGFSDFKTSLVRNPVDSSVFKITDRNSLRQKFGLSETDKVVLFLNEKKEYKRKGFQVFEEMLTEIIKLGYKVVFVGEKVNTLNSFVIQTGFANSDSELSEFYNLADLLMCTSLDDNLPNIISESHCCGTPVLAFSTGGIPEMINEGKNGFLVPKFDTQFYLNKLKEFLRADLNRNEISTTAHNVYSYSTAAKKYNEIYLND